MAPRAARLILLRLLPRLYKPAHSSRARADGYGTRLLLIRPDHLGDLLFLTPALRALRSALPQAHLTALVGPWARAVVERNPHLDQVLTCPFPGFTRQPKGFFLAPYLLLRRMTTQLRAQPFDTALILRFDHWWGAMLTYLAGIPRRVGYAVPECLPFLTQAVPYGSGRHEVLQNLTLVQALTATEAPLEPHHHPLEFHPSPEDESFAARWVSTFAARQRLVVIHPGAGAPVKLWQPQAFARVADGLIQECGVAVAITGSPAETSLVTQVAQGTKHEAHTLTHATLGQLGALLRRCALALGPDSGVLHLAVAAGAPTLHLYGPVDDATFGPWGNSDRHIVLKADPPCVPCNRLDYGPAELPYHPCIRQIEEERVLAMAKKLLGA